MHKYAPKERGFFVEDIETIVQAVTWVDNRWEEYGVELYEQLCHNKQYYFLKEGVVRGELLRELYGNK